MFGGSSYSFQHVQNIFPGPNEATQIVKFEIEVVRNGLTVVATDYFTVVPQIVVSGTTGTLIFTPLSTKEGDLSFIIRARDTARGE